LSILVVDDERVMRESCASYLEAEGYNVTVCSRGDKALETIKRRAFDIVLVDLYLSQVPGMELLRAALATHPDTIVIVMTGNPSVDSSLEALRAGAWDYLPKPFSATHLQILIGRAAHAVIVARESQSMQAQLDQTPGESEKFNVLGTAAFRKIILAAVAATDASVFITGRRLGRSSLPNSSTVRPALEPAIVSSTAPPS
jgi:DNA-binding NtrC family response regulator